MRIALFSLVLLAPSLAHAQEPPRSDQEARALFDAAQIAYNEGRYENALEHFQRSHELSGRPALLYNIGVTADRLRRDELALESYERYLREEPDTENRASVEARIEILRRTIADRRASPSNGSPSAGPDAAAIALTIGGSVVLAAGIALLIAAALDTAAVENAEFPSRWSEVEAAYDRAFPLSVSGWVAAGVGAAALGIGIALIATSGSSRTEVALGPRGIALRGSF